MLRPGRQAGAGRSLPSHNTGAGVGYGGSDYGYGGVGGGGGSYGDYGLNGSSSSSSSFGSSSRRGRRRGEPNIMALLQQPWMWATIASILFFCFAMYYRSQRSSLLKILRVNNMKEASRYHEHLYEDNTRWRREVDEARGGEREHKARNTILEKELERIARENEKLKAKMEAGSTDERFKARDDAWKKQVILLQKATIRESRRAAMERFGPGPHHVKFTFVLPHEDTEYTFVAEMAPLTIMPHAVHLFLQQVYHGLWDHTWMYLNGPHVLQWGPQQFYDGDGEGDDDRSAAMKPFRDLQLDTLAFPEYSHDYPHEPWTLGFTGRPGGPDVYINKVDNTVAHGPGGQYQHDLEEQADPCFAKIVEGRDNLSKVFAQPVLDDGTDYNFFLTDPVEIIKATIVEKLPDFKVVQKNGAAKEAAKKAPKKKFKMPKIDHAVAP